MHIYTGPEGEHRDVPRHAFPDGVLAPWRLAELVEAGLVDGAPADALAEPDPQPAAPAAARPAPRRKAR